MIVPEKIGAFDQQRRVATPGSRQCECNCPLSPLHPAMVSASVDRASVIFCLLGNAKTGVFGQRGGGVVVRGNDHK